MIDANINRVCEGLRVIEDFLRFELNDKKFINKLKIIRHFLRENISCKIRFNLIEKRDSDKDSGKKYSVIETNRANYIDLLKANFFRVEEGLRVLEEAAKIETELKKNVAKIKTQFLQFL